jgi:diacylglycerol kinase family enzyme
MDSLRARVWWARASLGLAVLAAVVLLAVAGRRGIWLVLLTAATVVVVVAAGFWFLLQRGVLRWLALALAVGAPGAVLVVFMAADLLWVALLAAGLLGAAVLTARIALRPDRSAWALPVVDAPPPRRPFVVMNPRSGGGKVARFGLQQRAEALGAEVALLDQPGTDVQQLAREALDRGADLLGVAGGDGTQALVAQVAAEHDVPFLVISAGTRNHFALDLGLDRQDPARCLDALRDGVEARIDLGEVNGRPFVNNASFGAYAEIVENPAYRNDKRGTTLDTLPDLLRGRRGAHLVADAAGLVVDGPQALLVSNDPYEAADLAGMGRRARIDRGVLGVIAVRVDSARQAVGLLHGAHLRGLLRAQSREVLVSSDESAIPVGIDGETVRLSTPVRCTVRPGALRVRLPRERPGVRPPRGRLDWASLWRLTVGSPTADALPDGGRLAPLPPGPSAMFSTGVPGGHGHHYVADYVDGWARVAQSRRAGRIPTSTAFGS